MCKMLSIEELMVKAGFLSEDDLNEAREIARGSGQQIGRVLVMSGFVTEPQLQLSEVVRDQLKDASMSEADAISTLRNSIEKS